MKKCWVVLRNSIRSMSRFKNLKSLKSLPSLFSVQAATEFKSTNARLEMSLGCYRKICLNSLRMRHSRKGWPRCSRVHLGLGHGKEMRKRSKKLCFLSLSWYLYLFLHLQPHQFLTKSKRNLHQASISTQLQWRNQLYPTFSHN